MVSIYIPDIKEKPVMKKKLAILFAIICLCVAPAIVKADLPDQAELEQKATAILNYLNLDGKNDYEIIYGIYNYICQNVEYDWAATAMTDWDGQSLGHGQLAYEALCQEKAVCAGISRAVKLLLDKLDIPCETVIGSLNGIAHAWNLVKLNDKWYYIDATSDLGMSTYSLFLKCEADLTNYQVQYYDGIAAADPDDYPISSTSYTETVQPEWDTYGGYSFNKGFGDITIFSYTGSEKNVVVPSTINGRKVKRIAQYFIEFNNIVESLIFSEGIQTLNCLFVGHCENLKSISIPSTLQYSTNTGRFITGLGFIDSCDAMETITVAAGNPFLCVIDGTLYNKDKTSIIYYPTQNHATVVHVPDGVRSIENETFEYNPYLEEVVLPDSVEYIGYWAFSNCSALKKINIPRNCTTIGQLAFQGTNLTKIHIPAATNAIICPAFPGTLQTITVDAANTEYYAEDNVLFSYSGGLLAYASMKPESTYTIPDGIKTIADRAFVEAINLQAVVLPDSLTFIGNNAFRRCSGLTEIIIPGNVTTIKDDAFYECYWLSKLTIPASVTEIGDSILTNVSGTVIIGESGSAAEEWANDHHYAFIRADIPWNLSGTCGENVSWTLSEDGRLRINGAGSMSNDEPQWEKYKNMVREVIVSGGVTNIGHSAFKGCRNLMRVSIPASVTSIEAYAFFQCDRLPSVYIPDSVIFIGEAGFGNCTDLVQFICLGDSLSFGEFVFSYSPDVVLYVSEGNKAHQYAINNNLEYRFPLSIPPSVTIIESEAFAGTDASIVFIPDTVTQIAADAFDRKVIIIAVSGSPAESWAMENGFLCILR